MIRKRGCEEYVALEVVDGLFEKFPDARRLRFQVDFVAT